MTLFTKTNFFSIVLLLFFTSLTAQNEAFWQEDFSDLTGPNLPQDWTTDDASVNVVQTLWQRCSLPSACPPSNIINEGIRDNFKSSTVDNGYAFSYSNENQNLSENHLSQLTSPWIVLPNLTNELYLEFQSFLTTIYTREHEGARLYVQVTGGDWEYFEIYPNVSDYDSGQPQKTQNANTFLTDLSQYVGASSIRLRWEWFGNKEIVWCLDDCKLFDYNPLNVRAIWNGGDFTGGLNDWMINNEIPESCSWEWEPIGYYGDALLPAGNDNKFINSPTARTGAVVVNGDNCFTSDLAPTMPLSTFYIFRSELISPTIDLSGTTDQVLLDFFQVIRKLDNDTTGVIPSPFLYSFSTDNGATWSSDEPLNESFPTNLTFNTHETILLPTDLIGESEVKIKFIFNGKLFYWGIDDVRILERAPNDLRISKDFFAIPPNYSTPVSQLDSVIFLADIENFGTEVQTDIILEVEIENIDTEQVVYRDSLFIPQALPLELIENQLFSTSFMPLPIVAKYKGTYRISSNNIDDIPQNNSVDFEFMVTDESFAKENTTSVGFSPANRNFSWGNVFYVPNGDGYYADSVFFTIANIEQMSGKTVQLELYEWMNNEEDILRATPDEFELVAVNIAEIEETTSNLTGIPVDLSGERKALKDDTQYFIVLKYQQPASSDVRCFLATSQRSDYLATYVASELRGDIRYGTLVGNILTNVFEIFGAGNGSGFDFVPQIRLSIADSPTSISDVSTEVELLEIYPNPTQSNFAIKSAKKNKGSLLIYNNLGELVKSENKFSTDEQISIGSLLRGAYFVHFVEEKTGQITVGKLIKM